MLSYSDRWVVDSLSPCACVRMRVADGYKSCVVLGCNKGFCRLNKINSLWLRFSRVQLHDYGYRDFISTQCLVALFPSCDACDLTIFVRGVSVSLFSILLHVSLSTSVGRCCMFLSHHMSAVHDMIQYWSGTLSIIKCIPMCLLHNVHLSLRVCHHLQNHSSLLLPILKCSLEVENGEWLGTEIWQPVSYPNVGILCKYKTRM